MPSNTSNNYFSKPTVGGDTDAWGTTLNNNWDAVDSVLSGGVQVLRLGLGTLNGSGAIPLKVSVASVANVVATFNGVTQFTGDVKITGNINNSDNSAILTVGSNSTAAVFTGNVSGNVTGDLTGDVYASNGTSKVLESGTDGTDAAFTGNVTGNVTGDVSGDAGTVNGFTVNKSVPANADFTNTQRAIHDTPQDGATTTSISSNWAFDNVKTAVPANALFTDTTYTAGTGISLSNGQFSADGANIDAGKVDGFSISTSASGTDSNTIYFRT
jgi:hypothetical protein